MQEHIELNSGDEINFHELFSIVWAYKFIITISCVMGVLYGGYNAVNTNKEFTSSATFQLSESNKETDLSSLNLASIARVGLSGSLSENSVSRDQINGLIFIKKIDAKVNLQTDPFFNNYNPNKTAEPFWKSFIKRAINWQEYPNNAQEAIWKGISNTFSKNVIINTFKGGVIKVSVTHSNPTRAAKLANTIMDEIISQKKQKSDKSQDNQLEYLSLTLAKAIDDLETSQSDLKAFALNNSIVPLESFTVETLQLQKLREQLSRTTELHDAITRLSLMLKNNDTSHSDYQLLRQTYPIVDQMEFRRVLGQNEIISSWNWPEISSVSAVLDTLSERKNRLKSKVDVSQAAAKRSSEVLETYGRLEREAKVAEAAYSVLIERVKAQSMLVGYRPSTYEIYEYASPPIIPSKPNLKAKIMIYAFVGLIIGGILSLAIANFRGVFYSRKSLTAAAQARQNFSIRTLNTLRNKNLIETNTLINKKILRPIIRDIAVEIHKDDTTLAVITSSRSKIKAHEVACALALGMQSDSINIAIIDFSKESKNLNLNTKQASFGSFIAYESMHQVSILRPENNLKAIELISQKEFLKKIHLLNSEFNLIFLCADNGDSISLLRALEKQKIFHLMLARIKHTKSSTIQRFRSLVPIQGLLHD